MGVRHHLADMLWGGQMANSLRSWTSPCITFSAACRVICCIVGVELLPPATLVFAQASADSSAAESAAAPGTAQTGSGRDILNLDIDQLAKTPVVVSSTSMDTPVTSVTKETSTVGHSAAAVFVITQEMIHRSGATCIPEALRMAPGLEVAQIDSNKWAISCRGFNSRNSNKLLVLMDGRTLYNPVTSGVIWDDQDYLLEDIDRIEVIRGPGGTLWGANAVNGVINIITKSAKNTQGAYMMAGGGTHERSTDGVRYGGQVGDDFCYRIYGKYFDRGPGFDPTGNADDAWRQGRWGFRSDWNPNHDQADTVTIEGDHFVGDSGTRDTEAIPAAPFQPPLRPIRGGIHSQHGRGLADAVAARLRREVRLDPADVLRQLHDGRPGVVWSREDI